jgi:hypothetical protein
MKIGFVFGKGIDGCGVTRGALFFEKWMHQNGHKSVVIDFINGNRYGRAKDNSFIGDILEVPANQQDVSAEIIKVANECDILICHSAPIRKHTPYCDRYRRFISQVKEPIVVMHDHGISTNTINSVPQACELFSYADVAVLQSEDGLSSRAYTDFDEGLKDRIIENPIWIEPDAYNKYLTDRPQKHFLYIGRMSPLKDPALICRSSKYMPDWNLSLVGCERSISSVAFDDTKELHRWPGPYIPPFRDFVRIHRFDKDGNIKHNCKLNDEQIKVNAYESYPYDWGMKTLGQSFASWCGYRLTDEREYGTRMEYTQIESFLLTLPVLNKQFAENAYSPEGKKWVDYDCALTAEANQEEAIAAELDRLWHNQNEWTDRKEACRELIYKFNDIEVLAPKYLDTIMKLGKRENKVNSMDVISTFFPNAKELREKGEVVMTAPGSYLKRQNYILVNNKQQKAEEETSSLESFFA